MFLLRIPFGESALACRQNTEVKGEGQAYPPMTHANARKGYGVNVHFVYEPFAFCHKEGNRP